MKGRAQLLEKIIQATLELTSVSQLEDLLHRIARAAADLTGSEAAGILLAEEENGVLHFVAATGHENQLLDIPVPIEQSIAGAAFLSGRPVLVPDVRQDTRYYAAVEQIMGFQARSLLCAPLCFQERKIGVLEVENKRRGRGFTSQDVETLTALAAQATVAIENTRSLESLYQARLQLETHLKERHYWLAAEQDQRKLAEALRQAVASLSSTLDFTEVVDRILVQIGQVIPNDASNIMLIEEDGFARVFRGRGYEKFGAAETLEATRVKIGNVRGLRQMVEIGRPLVIPDVLQDKNWVYSRSEHTWIRSYVGAPIIAHGKAIGFLTALSAKPRAFQQRDGERLQEFGSHAAIAITNARLYQQARQEIARRIAIEDELIRHQDHLEELVRERTLELTQALHTAEELNEQLQQEVAARQRAEEELRLMAITDVLTGVYNRRQLAVLGQQAFEEASRYQKPLSALMVDADHFKRINDTYGHTVGDEVLRLLGGYLRQALRRADILVRYGGEEFVVLMPETDLDEAHEVAVRLQAGVRELFLDTERGRVQITASIGVAAMEAEANESLDRLVDRADQAMYTAKQSGRNQIAVQRR